MSYDGGNYPPTIPLARPRTTSQSPGRPKLSRVPPPPTRAEVRVHQTHTQRPNTKASLLPAYHPDLPFPKQNAAQPKTTHLRGRSYDKPKRRSSLSDVELQTTSKTAQEVERQKHAAMAHSLHDLRVGISKSCTDPRYNRSSSAPLSFEAIHSEVKTSSIDERGKKKKKRKKEKRENEKTSEYLHRTNSSISIELENGFVEPLDLPEDTSSRPDSKRQDRLSIDRQYSTESKTRRKSQRKSSSKSREQHNSLEESISIGLPEPTFTGLYEYPEECDRFSENGSGSNDINAQMHYDNKPFDRRNIWDGCIDSMMCIFPKVEPLPWSTFFLLSLWCAIPAFGFITFFTAMGFGEHLYFVVADQFGEYASTLAIIVVSYIFVLYMLDADEWSTILGTLVLDVSILVIVAGIILLVLLLAYQLPYGMVCIVAVFNPLWLLIVRLVIYPSKSTRVFVSWLGGPLFTVCAFVGITWLLWVFSNPLHQWNDAARIRAAAYSRCEPNFDLYPECRKEEGSEEPCFYVETIDSIEYITFPQGCDGSCTGVYDDCLNGFILWVGPLLISFAMFFLGFFCTFFREETATERDLLNFGRIWIFILYSLWITASLYGTAVGMMTALVSITLASFVASAVFLTVSFNKEECVQTAAAVFDRLREKYNKHLDVIRGLFVWSCGPIIIIYCGLSRMNQMIRRTEIFPCSKPIRVEEGRVDVYTSRTRTQINVVTTWDRARVYTYALYWGIAFMALEVIIARLTVVFLSWLIIKVSDFDLLAVTCIIWGAGLIMFLLPPIPGVPVYLTIGIVLPAQGNEVLGWVGSIAYSIVIGLLLKLFACAIQQKIIGQQLSHYVKVRQAVGINSTIVRAMRLVVGSNGLSWSKVSILVGGPDWPTSVLCGIMRLPLLQILIGTIPVICTIIPTSLTGTFLYMASIEVEGKGVYPLAKTLATISASFTVLVQFGAMVVAAYYLEQAAEKRAEEIKNIPIDEDVEQADVSSDIIRKYYQEITQWSEISWWDKLLLRVALVCIMTCSYMVVLFPHHCFETHSLTDSIEDNLKGNAANLVLPLGWALVSMFLLSCLLLAIFQRKFNQKARKLAQSSIIEQSMRSVARRLSLRSFDQQSMCLENIH